MKTVYPQVYRLYWHGDMICVEVYETKAEMHARADGLNLHASEKNGAYHGFFYGVKPKTRGKCKSVIVCHEGQSGIGTMSHEFLHAALAWFQHRRRWNRVLPCNYVRMGWDKREEQLCEMLGELCRRYANQYWKRKERSK